MRRFFFDLLTKITKSIFSMSFYNISGVMERPLVRWQSTLTCLEIPAWAPKSTWRSTTHASTRTKSQQRYLAHNSKFSVLLSKLFYEHFSVPFPHGFWTAGLMICGILTRSPTASRLLRKPLRPRILPPFRPLHSRSPCLHQRPQSQLGRGHTAASAGGPFS